jgi:hypothetical protein
VDLIRQVFFNVDARAILCTPIRGQGNDAWAWVPERHGLYMVRSAYRRLYDDNNQPVNDGGASTSDEKTWKRIWGLCVPPKVRVFWWRVVNVFLPTRGVLHKRHIEPNPTCGMCGAADE